MSRNQPELVRGLGLWSASAIVVGSMIGTGIFLVPSEMARQAGSVPLVFAAWIAGAALTLFGALALAEMGSALPEAGGPYAYLKRGFGPVWGFLYGWTIAILERPASVAAIAAGVLRFGGYLTPAVVAPLFTWELALPFLSEPYAFRFTAAQPLAAAVILVVTGVNYLGIRLGGRVQVALTAAKVFALLA
ncbi:MAG TPA: amino acid permease, partial [Terriglobia bacterium]|nr:amino acid permease [Terriglobia bacterium]